MLSPVVLSRTYNFKGGKWKTSVNRSRSCDIQNLASKSGNVGCTNVKRKIVHVSLKKRHERTEKLESLLSKMVLHLKTKNFNVRECNPVHTLSGHMRAYCMVVIRRWRISLGGKGSWFWKKKKLIIRRKTNLRLKGISWRIVLLFLKKGFLWGYISRTGSSQLCAGGGRLSTTRHRLMYRFLRRRSLSGVFEEKKIDIMSPRK